MSSINTHRLLYAFTRLTGRMVWYQATETETLYHPQKRLLRCPPERLLDGLALASLAKHHHLGHAPVSGIPAGLETPFTRARQQLIELSSRIDFSSEESAP